MTQINQIQKLTDTIGTVKKLDHNTKITEIGNKIPSISGFANKSDLVGV